MTSFLLLIRVEDFARQVTVTNSYSSVKVFLMNELKIIRHNQQGLYNARQLSVPMFDKNKLLRV